MITLARSGVYRLIETKRNTRILYLDSHAYAWVEPWERKEILVVSHHSHITDCVLSIGDYCLYNVQDEPHLPGKQFLELEVGDDVWQGYILLTGLPTDHKTRSRIIATHEYVTTNPAYSDRDELTAAEDNEAGKGGVHEITRSI